MIPVLTQEELEEWLWKNLATRQFPHADVVVRDAYFRPWIIWQDEFDEWRATSHPLVHEDPGDCTGITLDRLSYSVTVLG